MGLTCDIFAHRIRNGRVTNELSTLHKDLLGLGGIAEKFTRWRANLVFYLAQSKKFANVHKDDLVYDDDGEPALASLFKIVPEAFGNDVTYEDIREYLLEPFNNDNDTGGIPFTSALDKVKKFNKKHRGAGVFMATIEDRGDGRYNVNVIYNSLEALNNLIETVANMQAGNLIIKRLSSKGAPIKVIEGLQTTFTLYGGAKFIQGIKGLIQLSNEDNNMLGLSKMAGLSIALILTDNKLVERLYKNITKNPWIIKEVLGEERYTLWENSPKGEQEVRELIGEFIGYYLEHYIQAAPKGIVLNFFYLVGKIVDWFKTHGHFKLSTIELNRALYQAKYDAWNLASLFMEGKLESKLSDKLSYKEAIEIRNASFKSIKNSVQRFGLMVDKIRKINGKLYKEFHDLFGQYLKSLNEGVIEYNQTVRENLLNGNRISSNIFNALTMDELAFQVYANMAQFVVLKIQEGTDLLLKLYDPSIELSMSEQSSIIEFNQQLYNMANHILKELRRIGTKNEELQLLLIDLANELSGILNNTSLIQVTETVHNPDGTKTSEDRTRTIASYRDLIMDARKSMCIDLLKKINGSRYLSIEKYVTVGDKHWYSVTRHKQAIKDLAKELEETDINPGYSFFSRFIDSMADSPDIINQMVYDVIEEEKHKANIRTLTTREKLRRMYQFLLNMEWVDLDGNKRKGGIDTKLFYETYYAVDEDGNILKDKDKKTIIMSKNLTGNFISRRNWGEWEREKSAHMREWEEEYWEKSFVYQNDYGEFKFGDSYVFNGVAYYYDKNSSKEQREEYRRHFHDYVNTNATITLLTYYYKRDMYDDFTFLTEYGLEKENWHSANSVKIPLTDSSGKEVINEEDGEIVQVWAPAISTDTESENYNKLNFYDNPLYKWLELEGNEELLKWYNTFLSIKQQLDEKLPPGSTLPFGLRAPLFMGTVSNRLHNALGEGGGLEFAATIMRHIWYGIDESPDDIEFGGENNTYNKEDLYDGKGTLIYDREYVNALNSEQRLPVYGVRKLSKMHDLSTDMVFSLLAYTAMADNYDCLNDVVGAVEQLSTLLYDRKVDNTLAISELESKDVPSSYSRLQDYMKMQVFNDYSGSHSEKKKSRKVRKMVGKLCLWSSLYYLGGNIHSAITNCLTAASQLISEAWGGTDFGVIDLSVVCAQFTWYKTLSLFRLGYNMFTEKGSEIEDRSKFTLWKRRFNVLNNNESDFRDMHIATRGYTVFGKYSYSEISMLPYSITDEWMQTISFMASARALKLTKIGVKQKDGTIVGLDLSKKISLWDLYTVDKNTGELVCSDGNFEEWGIPNKNLLSVKELFENSEGTLLEEEELLFLDSFTDESGNELDPSESPAWLHWDLKLENRFRLQCRGINNRLNGIYNRGDGGAALGTIIGPLSLSLKKYAIGMFDRRFARARYDYRTKRIRQGMATTFADLFVDLVINKDISDLDNLSAFDRMPVMRQISGFLKLIFMYLASMNHVGALGNNYRRRYLEKRGYSAEQIANIDRATAEFMNIAFNRIIIGMCIPPEDDADFDLEEATDLWWGGDLMYFLYRLALQHTPFNKTVDDETNLTKEALNQRVLKGSKIAPFSFKGFVLYQAYRTLREQEAYNLPTTVVSMLFSGSGGLFTEYRSLTESFLPSFAFLEDGFKLMKAAYPIIAKTLFDAGLTYDDWMALPTNEAAKYDYSVMADPSEAYGALIYRKGVNRDFYKYANALLRITPILRSGKVYFDPLTAVNSMEYSKSSDLFKEMRTYNRKNWKGWANTAVGFRLFNDLKAE